MENASEIRVNVSADLLSRAALCKSTDAGRYYLNGVYVTPAKAGGVLLVATDGHTMAVLHDKEGSASQAVILDPDKAMLAWAKKPAKGTRAIRRRGRVSKAGPPALGPKRILFAKGCLYGLQQGFISDDESFDLRNVQSMQWNDTWVDGTFPDFHRVVPASCSHIATIYGIDGYLVERITNVLGGNSHHALQFRTEKQGSTGEPIVALCSNASFGFCIIMPLRYGGLERYPEFWTDEKPSVSLDGIVKDAAAAQ